jgi:hypothetical protein
MTAPASATLDELAARLSRAEQAIAAHDLALTATPAEPADAASGAAEAAPAEPAFADVQTWVEDYFVLVFGRSVGGEFRWCPRWWDHVEAITRLEALWRTWEHLRLDPQTGIAVWLRDHLDHQLPRLMAPTGPFARCTPDRHEPDRPLPATPPPPTWPDTDP